MKNSSSAFLQDRLLRLQQGDGFLDIKNPSIVKYRYKIAVGRVRGAE